MAHDQNDETPASPFSSTGFQLSALFLLVLLVAGIAIAIFHGGNGTAKGSRKQVIVSANSPSGTSTTNTSAGPCSLPAGSQQVPSGSPPAGVTWNVVGSMSVPQSGALGPQHTQDGLNVCFAHNPTGALLAAMNYYAEGTSTTVTARQLAEQLMVNVPRAALAQSGNGAPGALDAGGPVQIAGYKFASYSASQATYDVVIQGPKGALASVTTTMIWTGQDWRYSWPTGGDPSMEVLQERTLTAPYVVWSAF
jgi:hypothetical protein